MSENEIMRQKTTQVVNGNKKKKRRKKKREIIIGTSFLAMEAVIFQTICHLTTLEARWHSGRASDSESRGPGFDSYMRHRVVFLSKTQYWLNSGRVGSALT